jgi:hypothetical protein
MSSAVSDESFQRSSRISFAPGTKEGVNIPYGIEEDLLEIDEVEELVLTSNVFQKCELHNSTRTPL